MHDKQANKWKPVYNMLEWAAFTISLVILVRSNGCHTGPGKIKLAMVTGKLNCIFQLIPLNDPY